MHINYSVLVVFFRPSADIFSLLLFLVKEECGVDSEEIKMGNCGT